ncbi:MAG: hypothetical protein VR65_10420 [Desulfobulbaceae bacterium BRH_c16a]|nr:MAG: hypothetical protein VR65_10420 [Desulfobulbaceae bacterium BRH_c16a]
MIHLEVAVAVPLEQTLTYGLPAAMEKSGQESDGRQHIGRRVLVPLGKRRVTGYVIGIPPQTDTQSSFTIKEIAAFQGDYPVIHADFVSFFRWVANYYHYPLGLVIKAALPGGLAPQSLKRLVLEISPEQFLLQFPEQPPDQLPDWAGRLADCGMLSPKETSTVLLDKLGKKLLAKLLKENAVSFKSLLSKDTIGEKNELCYALTGQQTEPPGEIDGSRESLLRYRQEISQEKGIDLKFSEAKALYCLYDLTKETRQQIIPLKEIRTRYVGSAKALAELEAKGMVSSTRERIYRNPFGQQLPFHPRPETLTDEQAGVLEMLRPAIREKRFAPFLLHGVTGCGKTEIYLRAAEETLAQGRDVLLLVPEIALATQLEAHLLSRFGDQVVLQHSGLTAAERFDQFSLALFGRAKVVIGARSAIFAPLRDPGLIVVDEEHDASFKQDDSFRYHGRDLAVLRARHHKSVVILGSATPSITSYAHAQSGKYTLLTMSERVGSRSLPSVTVVDLNKKDNKDSKGIIKKDLLEKLSKNLERGKQSILLLNRRGFSAVVLCRDCGTPVQCSHCHVSLTLHKGRNKLICHYCGFSMPGKTICLQCRSDDLVPAGFGTERVEEEIRELLPSARLARLDSDTASDRKKFLAALAEMHSGKIDILIGTQMIAKGHHFPNVTLVGVVWADGGMSMPDFRAAEKTFQLITQVTGRAGRGDQAGEVLIQTMRPSHYAIVYAKDHEYRKMFEHEMRLRRNPVFPPYVRLTAMRIQGRVEAEVQKTAVAIAGFCRKFAQKENYRLETLGPAPSPLDKIADNYRWQVLLKSPDLDQLHGICVAVRAERNGLVKAGCSLVIDVDPENMM